MAKRIASACVCLLVALVFAAPAGASTEPDHTLVEAGKAMTMVVDYVAALEAEQARVDAALASLGEQIAAYVYAAEHPPPPPPRAADPAPVRAAGGGGGSCYAGPIPAYIVTRESGGDPFAVNPSSGAYGCFQVMPATWSASCSDLSRDVAGQIACASRISNGGTNLRPWATG